MAYYNGKKVIGNARLDLKSPVYNFAKSELEKSLNLFDNNGNISLMNIGLVEGEQYTIRIFNSTTPYYYKIAHQKTASNTEVLATGNFSNGGFTFTFNTERNWNLYIWDKNWQSLNLTDYEIMIVKGTVVPETFNKFNGKLIREIDITPVLLWKNGNPNVAFEPTDITVSNLDKFSKIVVVYKEINDSSGLPKEMVFDVKYNCYGFLLGAEVDNLGTLLSRSFKVTNQTTIRFGAANLGSLGGHNHYCIPLEVYGSNY